MARLSLSLLGPFQATQDGEPIMGFPSVKVRALLAYLAVEADRPHPREALAGLLWPDYPDRSARTNLSNALSHLRTVLCDRDRTATGGSGSVLTPRHQEHKADTQARADTQVRPYILVDRETVQFSPESDAWVDVPEFSRLAEADPSVSGSDAAHQLEEAIGLYRGSFLEGFSLHDSPPFEQWVLVTRERLQRQMMEALARLSTYHEQQGKYRQALAHARRQLEIEPWREGAHRQCMRVLALSGQHDAALAQYEACVRALREELDVEPTAETTELYHAIRANEPLIPAAPVADTQPSELPPARPHNLPAQATPFVGRERELDELSRLLTDPQARLVTIVGPGGCGKTRLALQAAAGQVGRYEHGVWFASLAALQSAEGIVPAMAMAVGFQFYPGGEPRQQLLGYLREKRMLLVLDNWEHLLAGVDLLADLLAAAPGVHVLATSRARLNLQGEHVFHLEGMEYPHPSPGGRGAGGEGAMHYSAVQLFLQSAQRIDPKGFGKPLGSDDLDAVVRLCQLVEGMPLALVLAAAWLEMLSPAEIAAEVERSLDFLTAEWRDLPERQRSVRAVFDHSWRLLSEREQQVFAALPVFRGGFTREAAEQVAGADLRVLASLVNKSLITLAKTEPEDRAGLGDRRGLCGRYDMHELLRQYAQDKLDGSPDGGQETRDRHAAYYASALRHWGEELKGSRQQAALVEMDVEMANARAAWEWASAQGQVGWLNQGMDGLGWFYDWRSRYQEGEAVFRNAADRLAATSRSWQEGHAGHGRALARLWAWQSHLGRPLGHTEQARTLLRQSLDLLERLESVGCDVRQERALALWQEGEIESWAGSAMEARSLLEKSLALYRSLGAGWETATVLGDLAQVLQGLGLYDQAEQTQREALALHRGLGNQHGVIDSVRSLAWLLNERGSFDEAERLLLESLALARAMGIPFAIDFALAMLCNTMVWQGRFAEARSLADDALVAYRGRPDRAMSDRFAANISEYELHLGRYAEARLAAQTGLALARRIDFRWQIGAALLHLGRAAMAEGAYAEAGQCVQESLEIFQRIGNWALVICTLALLAGVALLQGDLAAARQHLGRALRMLSERRSFIALLFGLPFLARLLAEQGEAERAVEIYALASRYPHVANSPWYADVVGKRIAEVAATLPPEVVAAAQARGRARDMWATAEELAAEMDQESTDDQRP